jgi:site-specific recombinase XerD
VRLSEAIDALCIATRASGRSPRTLQSYREKLSYLVAFLEDAPIEGITTTDLRRYLAHLWDRDLSPFTVNSRVRALKRLFNFLEAEGIIADNPARRIRVPRPKRDEPKGISWSDFLALLETTDGDSLADVRDRAVIMFLFDTACRVGGLCGLEVDDLDMERRRAKVREKGNKTRFVFFEELTARAVDDWLKIRPRDRGDWLFISFGGQSDKLTTRGVSHMLRRRGKRAGCRGPVNPHAFRHGFARHFLMDGGDLSALCDILGHSDVSVTKAFYGIFTTGDLQEQHGRHTPIAGLGGGENGE